MRTGYRVTLAVFVFAAIWLAGPVGAKAADSIEILLTGKIQPPLKIIKGDTLTDDWVTAFITVADARNQQFLLEWNEKGFFVRGPDEYFGTRPGDANEHLLLRLLIDAYPQVHEKAFDDPDWYKGTHPEGETHKWFLWKAVQKIIRGLEIRDKLKRQPLYDERVKVGPI